MSLSPERKGRLTASIFASAIGIGYDSRQKLWRQLTGREEAFAGNDATQWGSDHEQFAIDRYEAVTGNIVECGGNGQSFVILNDWIGCTPDGVVNGEINIEAKCPFSMRIYGCIPAHYMAQVQGQMAITGFNQTHFIVWTPEDFEVYEVGFNKEYWLHMYELLAEFRQYLLDDLEPKRKKKPVLPAIEYTRIV